MRLGARIARLEQRRKMQATKRFPEACTCFPADEQPGFKWRAEAEIAAAVLCPLHGLRFHIVITRDLYRAFRFYITDYKDGWPHQSAQYQKAMRASFDWALWPPQKEKDLGHDSVLILRDGTELPSGGSAIGYTPGYWLALSYPTSKAALAASRPSMSMRPRAACNRSCF